jgi:hypothetical protein
MKRIVVPRADFDRMVAACLNPPPPSQHLIDLVKRTRAVTAMIPVKGD